MASDKPPYDIVLSKIALEQLIQYKNDISSGIKSPGAYFKKRLGEDRNLEGTSNRKFMEMLLSTKKPTIFAESGVKGDETDWNPSELEILGNINVTMAVEVYDNGVWSPSDKHFKRHHPPLEGHLMFTPGALLVKGVTPDYEEVVTGNKIDQEKYNKLVDRRLTPLLVHANETAKKDGKPAFITIPGIGCGQFAGRFRGTVGDHLNKALQHILEKNGKMYKNISCIYFDPFNECRNQSATINGIEYLVRPNLQNPSKAQLSDPKHFSGFENCKLYKIVAWDHVSLPGNDYFLGTRSTDDGVAAAATNSMEVITGVKGCYREGHYLPPSGNINWRQVVRNQGVHLMARQNVKVVTPNGSYVAYKSSTVLAEKE